MKALKKQGRSRDDLAYKAPFQPYGSWFALIATGIITFFKGFDTFLPFTKDTFVTSYIGIPVFFVFWLGYKYGCRSRVIPLDKVDLDTGCDALVAAIDAEPVVADVPRWPWLPLGKVMTHLPEQVSRRFV